MRIRQAHISTGVATFKDNYLKKFKLIEGNDITEPIVFFGMYDDNDYKKYLEHKGPVIVVLCGTDGLMISDERAKILKSKDAKHIAKSSFISNDLRKKGIRHKLLPITWQQGKIDITPLGENIFHYGNGRDNFYGDNYLPEIKRRTGLNIIKTTKHTYPKEELRKIYSSCFVGLRLTNHDGIPNTVIELGQMGRRCIYNGYLPNAIPWKNIDDICKYVMSEYHTRHRKNLTQIAVRVNNFIDIGDNWLNV